MAPPSTVGGYTGHGSGLHISQGNRFTVVLFIRAMMLSYTDRRVDFKCEIATASGFEASTLRYGVESQTQAT
jgi:hypothetical protein